MGNKGLSVKKEDRAAPVEKQKSGTWVSPAVDIFENDEGLTLMADLPGVAKEGLNLGIDSGVLTVEGKIEGGGEGQGRWSEFSTAGYYRRFQIPENLDLEHVEASLKDGVLTLKMPKLAAARPKRIEVTVH